MSSIYKARHVNKDFTVIVKLFTQKAYNNLKQAASIFNEYEEEGVVALNLNHKNIVRIYDCGKHRGRFYYVMELIDGDTLEHLLAAHDPWVESHKMDIIRQIAAGLDYLHSRGILHRDICPMNIMVRRDTKEVKIIDLGLAVPMESKNADVLWRPGTASYMAPEYIKFKTIDMRTDIYSLGVTVFKILVEQLPFSWHSEPRGRMQQHLQCKPFLPTAYDPAILPFVEEIVMKMLEKEPSARYQSMKEVLQALSVMDGRWRNTRVHPRYHIDIPVVCRIPALDKSPEGRSWYVREGTIRDISQGGAKVELSSECVVALRECYFRKKNVIIEGTLPFVERPVKMVSSIRGFKYDKRARGSNIVTLNLCFEECCGDSRDILHRFLEKIQHE